METVSIAVDNISPETGYWCGPLFLGTLSRKDSPRTMQAQGVAFSGDFTVKCWPTVGGLKVGQFWALADDCFEWQRDC
jgi:hypothetical protein